MPRATTATLHTDALRHNLALLRAQAPRSRVMAMVKADAYGHGMERVARALPQADAFGVAALSEARRLRDAGIRQPVLLLPGFDEPADIQQLRELSVSTTVHQAGQLQMLEQAPSGAPVDCWLKVDSGMHRLGFPPGQVRDAHARLAALPGVGEIVLMNHFASSDEPGSAVTQVQMRVFAEATAGLAGARSLANSAAVFDCPEAHADWLRPGGTLYGMSLVEGRTGADHGLRAAMSFHTRLIAVHRIARGERIGYSGTWTCPEDMPVGVAAVGYGDGYPRAAPSGTQVLVGGRRVPLVGRVSMDLVTLDLRGAPDARVGAPVLLWGPELPVEHIAVAAGTIGYDLTCGVTSRVRRDED
ncbi:MAG: alanine racemase [Pseudomonadota bacterium]|nr:alanine racemase [Pseudomonadota bacterium]